MRSVYINVQGFSIPYSNRVLARGLVLNEFQARVQDYVRAGSNIELVAPTGSGKTLTLLLNDSGKSDLNGFTAIYPNNTLLRNQMSTIVSILEDYFGAKRVYTSDYCQEPSDDCVEPLQVFELDLEASGSAWPGDRFVALMALSGKYIPSISGVPKRDVLARLARAIFGFQSKGGVYTIVFSTPDTFLLVYTGAYRDFEGVGKTLHNTLLAIARGARPKDLENILRETGVLARAAVDETMAFAVRLLDMPLFIDEFHLYGVYELNALHGLLRLYKTMSENSVILSSATPAQELVNELGSIIGGFTRIQAMISADKGFPVRGDTTIVIIGVDTRRKGLSAYYEAGERLLQLIEEGHIDISPRDGKSLIILERLWMVSRLARVLSGKGLEVECIASIYPKDACGKGAPIIIGSEAATQGVNLGRVVVGVFSGTSAEDVIQRLGRVGRRGVPSTVYLVAPSYVLQNISNGNNISYYDLVQLISDIYPDYPKRKRDISGVLPKRYHESRRKLVYTLGIASLARVSGRTDLLSRIDLDPAEARIMLDEVIGSPEALARVILFRRTGFNVRVHVKENDEEKNVSIGIIARNFRVVGAREDGTILITLDKSRSRISFVAKNDVSPFRGRFIDLRTLLNILDGRIKLGEDVEIYESQVRDRVLVYVGDLGEKLSEYLSITGEGGEIQGPSGSRYSAVFV